MLIESLKMGSCEVGEPRDSITGASVTGGVVRLEDLMAATGDNELPEFEASSISD
jgi:hypothetical protein